MDFANTVRRVHEDPRVTRPYTPAQIDHLQRLGADGGRPSGGRRRGADHGRRADLRGSSTTPPHPNGPSPPTAAEARAGQPPRRRAVAESSRRAGWFSAARASGTRARPLPRWQIGLIWRQTASRCGDEPELLADPFDARAGRGRFGRDGRAAGEGDHGGLWSADRAAPSLLRGSPGRAGRRGRPARQVRVLRLTPTTADPAFVAELDQSATPVAWALPLAPAWWGEGWASAAWRTRRGRLVLVRGESPGGFPAAARLACPGRTRTSPGKRATSTPIR